MKNFLQLIKENKSKVAAMDHVTFKVFGTVASTEKAICWLIDSSKTDGPVEKWIPISVFDHGDSENTIKVDGWFASKELFGLIKMNTL